MASRVTLGIVLWFVTLAMTCPVGAQPLVEAVAKRFDASSTPSGVTHPVALTPDGRFLLFNSSASDVASDQKDSNGVYDAFVVERIGISLPPMLPAAAEVVLPVPGESGRTGNFGSEGMAISDDGRFVLVRTSSTNLLPPGHDGTDLPDLYLVDRQREERVLVTRSASDPTRTADSGGGFNGATVSPDARWVAFDSDSDDLLTGFTDHSVGPDAFLFDRTTGVMELVSRASGQPTTGAGPGGSVPRAVSADGRYVLFESVATNLVPGFVPGSALQVYRFDRVTGTSRLVSVVHGTTTSAANGDSKAFGLSSDGRFALFMSTATNLVPGSDSNGLFDSFLADLTLGTMALVSHSAVGPNMAANRESNPKQMSSDGRFVLFQSRASDLIVGGSDTNGQDDVFLFDRTDGTVRLVSRSPASPLIAATGSSRPGTVAEDGSSVTFWTSAPDLAGVDTNSSFDVFRWDRVAGTLTLLSSTVGDREVTAGGTSCCTVASGDANHIVFVSLAPELAPPDVNGQADLFSPGPQLEVGRGAVVETTRPGGSDLRAMSPDGRFVLVGARASSLMDGLTGSNIFSRDALVYDRQKRTWDLVAHAHGSPTELPDARVEALAISANGRYVVFETRATNIVAGYVPNGSNATSVYWYDRVTRQALLVSHALGQVTQQADGPSGGGLISDDGRIVVFASLGRNLIPNPQGLGQNNLFVYDTTTRQAQLVNHTLGLPTAWTSGSARWWTLSSDGRFLLFESRSTSLVPIDTNGELDLFVFDRLTGINDLITRSQADPPATSAGLVEGGAMTPDGRFVVFASNATDLVAGVNDINLGADVFQRDRVLGVTRLISHAVGQPLVAGPAATNVHSQSTDGRFVSLRHRLVNVASFIQTSIYDRETSLATLLSHAAGTPTLPGNGHSQPVGLSSTGRWVAFTSTATDLLPGGLAPGPPNLYLSDRVSGEVRIVTPAEGVPGRGVNSGVTQIQSLSQDGNTLAFSSDASNLVVGDSNDFGDGFVYSTAIFTDCFESGDTSSWSSASPPLP
jgi:Tol biopolymer transport system component